MTPGRARAGLLVLPQGPIAYEERGEGPPLVFVHGFGCNARLWASLADQLAAHGWRCITPTWPMGAHHAPMRRDADLSLEGLADIVEAFIDARGLDSVTLIGNDAGGAISQIVATRANPRVARLVLTPCDAFDNVPPPPIRPLTWAARIPGAAWLLSRLLQVRMVQQLPMTYGLTTRQPIDPAIMNAFIAPLRRDPRIRRDALRLLRAVDDRPVQRAAARLPTFTGPALIVWGTADQLFPPRHAHQLARCLPNSTLALIEGARSFLSLDAPDALGHHLRDFLTASDPQLATHAATSHRAPPAKDTT